MRTSILLLTLFYALTLSSCSTRYVARQNQTVSVIKTPPRHYTTVRVKGKKYDFWNGNHYKRTRGGYIYVRL